ncbi:hypothetical protein HDU92_003491 [Lobulomyces angularis]|nr:hypothetical protein HDU92_003491 [Lobulomyces angularis]
MFILITPKKYVLFQAKNEKLPLKMPLTPVIRRPTSSIIHWRSPTLRAIDVERSTIEASNILMELGKSMEKMMVLSEKDYSYYLKDKEIPSTNVIEEDCFNYTKVGDFLIRSQIDCKYESEKSKARKKTLIFDLKTRAIRNIRLDVHNYKRYVTYKIRKIFGPRLTWESEYCDMLRSVFVKWKFQGKLGLMDGMFVFHHSTKKALGFQYISMKKIDRALCGSVAFGDFMFKMSMQLLNALLNALVKRYPTHNLRLTVDSSPVQHVILFVEPIPHTEKFVADEIETTKNDIIMFNVFAQLKNNSSKSSLTETEINNLKKNKHLSLDYSIVEITDISREKVLDLWSQTRKRCSNLNIEKTKKEPSLADNLQQLSKITTAVRSTSVEDISSANMQNASDLKDLKSEIDPKVVPEEEDTRNVRKNHIIQSVATGEKPISIQGDIISFISEFVKGAGHFFKRVWEPLKSSMPQSKIDNSLNEVKQKADGIKQKSAEDLQHNFKNNQNNDLSSGNSTVIEDSKVKDNAVFKDDSIKAEISALKNTTILKDDSKKSENSALKNTTILNDDLTIKDDSQKTANCLEKKKLRYPFNQFVESKADNIKPAKKKPHVGRKVIEDVAGNAVEREQSYLLQSVKIAGLHSKTVLSRGKTKTSNMIDEEKNEKTRKKVQCVSFLGDNISADPTSQHGKSKNSEKDALPNEHQKSQRTKVNSKKKLIVSNLESTGSGVNIGDEHFKK